jgi:hypothetical protein
LQYDSPLDFSTHVPSFLHGDGEHDMNPEVELNNPNNIIQLSKNLIQISVFVIFS